MRFRLLSAIAAILALTIINGCESGKNSTTGPASPEGGSAPPSNVTLSQYSDLVAQVAPPVYGQERVMQRAAVDDSVDVWSEGDYPILNKVFGESEPFSLWRNLNDLDFYIRLINEAIADGPGVHSMTAPDGQSVSATVDYFALKGPIAIPAAAQSALTVASVDLAYCVTVDVPSFGVHIRIAFSKDTAQETVLVFFHSTRTENGGETPINDSSLVYAHRNLATGDVVIRNTFYKDFGGAEAANVRWVYTINVAGTDHFIYRTSWYSADLGTPQLSCLTGGGNKDELFVLRYRQFVPADNPESNGPMGNLVQVFGPGYARVAGDLSSAMAEYADQTPYTKTAMLSGLMTCPMPEIAP